MTTRPHAVRFLAALGLVLGLTSPMMGHGGTAATTHAANAQAAGAVLRISDEGESDLASIDPPSPSAGDAQANVVENLVFGGLVRLDQNLQVQPNAASSWTVSTDGKIYTFTLRPGLKWGDGTPVTAQDVVWSLTRAFSPAYAAGGVSFYLSHIVGGLDMANGKAKTVKGLQAIGTNKVRITLDQPAAVFLDDLAYSVAFLVPRAQVEKSGNNWTEHAAALGPFIVKQWKHNQEIDLAPNPYYWRGTLKLGGAVVEFIKNTETAYNLYRTGALDVMGIVNFPGNHLKDVQGTPDFHTTPQLFTEFLVVNEHHAPLNNPLVRQALSYAVNRATIVKLLDNRFLPASGMLPPGMPGYNKNLVGETFDQAKAKQLLAKAGYPGGKGFPSLTLNVDGGDNDGQTKAVALQEFWKQVLGITVHLSQLEHGAYTSALTAHNFDLSAVQWGADYPDPQDFLSLLLHTGVAFNNGYFSNKQFDTLTEAADIMPHNSPARYQKYQQAEQVLMNAAGCIVIDWGKTNVLINPKVKGITLTALGGGSLIIPPNWAGVTVQ